MSTLAIDSDIDRAIVHELSAPAASLLDRHLSVSKAWYPFEDVPWEHATDYAPGEDWDDGRYPLPQGVQSAIIVNVLTEDNLPYYTHTLLTSVHRDHPLQEWTRRWTAEEWRHSAAIRDWILATRAVDPYQLERDRMVQMSTGEVPQADSVVELIAYVTFQELATQVAHRNTAQMLDKELRGKKIMSKVAGDEGLHHAFYRDLAAAVLEIDASTMLVAIQRQLRTFKMPGTGIPGFAEREVEIAATGIFDAVGFCDQVVKPTLAAWGIEELTGLTPAGERARDKIRQNVSGLDRLAAVQQRQLLALQH